MVVCFLFLLCLVLLCLRAVPRLHLALSTHLLIFSALMYHSGPGAYHACLLAPLEDVRSDVDITLCTLPECVNAVIHMHYAHISTAEIPQRIVRCLVLRVWVLGCIPFFFFDVVDDLTRRVY